MYPSIVYATIYFWSEVEMETNPQTDECIHQNTLGRIAVLGGWGQKDISRRAHEKVWCVALLEGM